MSAARSDVEWEERLHAECGTASKVWKHLIQNAKSRTCVNLVGKDRDNWARAYQLILNFLPRAQSAIEGLGAETLEGVLTALFQIRYERECTDTSDVLGYNDKPKIPPKTEEELAKSVKEMEGINTAVVSDGIPG